MDLETEQDGLKKNTSKMPVHVEARTLEGSTCVTVGYDAGYDSRKLPKRSGRAFKVAKDDFRALHGWLTIEGYDGRRRNVFHDKTLSQY